MNDRTRRRRLLVSGSLLAGGLLVGPGLTAARGESGLEVRPPGSRLAKLNGDGIDEVGFVVAVLWVTTFDGLVHTRTALVGVSAVAGVRPVVVRFGGFVAFSVAFPAAIVLVPGVVPTTIAPEELARRFAPSLVPIAAGYHFARLQVLTSRRDGRLRREPVDRHATGTHELVTRPDDTEASVLWSTVLNEQVLALHEDMNVQTAAPIPNASPTGTPARPSERRFATTGSRRWVPSRSCTSSSSSRTGSPAERRASGLGGVRRHE